MPTADPAEPHTVTPGTEARPQVDTILEAKLHWPPGRDDWVRRERLIDQMHRATRHQVTLVAAPAGYGKTILVAQWLGSRAASPCCVGLARPRRQRPQPAVGARRRGPRPAPAARCPLSLPPNGPAATCPGRCSRRIVNALAAMPDEIVIVLDDFHFLRDAACHDQVEFLVDSLPAQAHLVIITRADPGLRLGRLRASGGLAEIRADDLASPRRRRPPCSPREDVHLSDASRSSSSCNAPRVGRPASTSPRCPWPVGATPTSSSAQFSGGNRFVGDYLTEEVLSRHTDEVREFITSMSILDRFSAPLCDHVLGHDGLGRDPARPRAHQPVPRPARRRGGVWFRFHHLFAAVARSELEIDAPRAGAGPCTRGPLEWFRDHGHIDEAVKHSLRRRRRRGRGLLVQENWLAYVDAGRAATVRGWLEALGAARGRTDPAAEVTAAWMAALSGDEEAWPGTSPRSRSSATTARCRTAPGRSSPRSR